MTTTGAPGKADRHRTLKIALGVSGSFTALVALVMLVGLLGLYVGLGVLFAVYRFIDTLE